MKYNKTNKDKVKVIVIVRENKKVGGKVKNKDKVNLSSLYDMQAQHTYTIVSYLSSLYEKYTLQQLYLLSPFSPSIIRYYSELIPYMNYSKYLPPEYLYELRNLKRNSDGIHNNEDINKAIQYYNINKPSISAYRKYIRNYISTVTNNSKIKINNSKTNKNKYFKLREEWSEEINNE